MARGNDSTARRARSEAASRFWRQVLLSVLAISPILFAYIPHFTSPEGHPTGFIAGDMPYYCANGREIFERGNGFAYPNPLDTEPESPVIYFHWYIWILGVAIMKLGLDPGLVYVGVGLIAALLMAWMTRLLVKEVLPDARYRMLLFFVAMWGGGLINLYQATANFLLGRDLFFRFFRLDPGDGLWFLNWGRNLLYPNEIVYHAVAAACWVAALRGRWGLAAAMAALVAATHPFSGLQVLLILLAWWSLQIVIRRDRRTLVFWSVSVVSMGLFVAYYFVFLESFPQHRDLRADWTQEWILSGKTLMVAYGPVAVLALWRLWRDRRDFGAKEQFLLTCLGVSLALALHDRFMTAVQPLHFARGFVWLPFFLLAAPLLQRTLLHLKTIASRPVMPALVTCFCLVACSDNIAFLTREVLQWGSRGFHLSGDERQMLTWLEENRVEGVVFCDSPDLCYLTATYTRLIPYYGHRHVSPNHVLHERQIRSWFEGRETGPWIEKMDYLLVNRNTDTPLLNQDSWTPFHSNEQLILFRRSAAP